MIYTAEHEFAFSVTLTGVVKVRAATEAQAWRRLRQATYCAGADHVHGQEDEDQQTSGEGFGEVARVTEIYVELDPEAESPRLTEVDGRKVSE